MASYCGTYGPDNPHHPDWEKDKPSRTTCTPAPGGSGCSDCECITRVVPCLQTCCLRYELFPEIYGYNSNSVAWTSLLRCVTVASLNVQEPDEHLPPDAPPLGAPGWGVEIPLSTCNCP